MSTPVKPVTVMPATPPTATYELASPSVILKGVKAELLQFVEYLGLVHRVVFNKVLVITSGRDGVHTPGSLHPPGLALDIRTTDLLPDEQGLLLSLLAYAAPANHITYFDERALPGDPHIHLEYHG
jgi:hypothetical protein